MGSKLLIAAAGAGKTTFLIKEANKINSRILITTYTRSNEEEIKKAIINEYGCIPSHIDLLTWYEFLLRHGVRPFQGSMNDSLYEKSIGFILTNEQSTIGIEEKNTLRYYFTTKLKIYSDKISKFIINCNEKINGSIISRIESIYSHIFIDEIQDMVGYDLDILNLLIKSNIELLLVGDPRQTTYSTHPTPKYKKYQDGKIESYFKEVVNKKNEICKIDKKTLNRSHRNNQIICNLSSKLYPFLPKAEECICNNCRNYDKNEHIGTFLLFKRDVSNYLEKYEPIQLRWNVKTKGDPKFPIHNFGDAKGKSFDRVLIYPTKDMKLWIINNDHILEDQTRAKFYVAITRARKSSTIIIDDDMDITKIGDDYCFYTP